MSLRRPPRAPERVLWDATRAQRTGGSGIVYGAAPIPAHSSAVAQSQASVAATSDKAWARDRFVLTADGAQTKTLTYLPVDNSLFVFLNTEFQDEGTGRDWTVSGQTLNVLSGMGALTDDILTCKYQYLTGQPAEVTDLPAGLLLWLRATDLGGVDNTAVSSWPDQSGNGNNATGTGDSGATPVLKTGQSTADGVAVYVDSTSSHRHFVFGNFLSSLTAAEVFVVVKAVNDPPPQGAGNDVNNGGFWKFGSGTGSSSAAHYPYQDGSIYDGWGSTTRKTVGNPTPALTSWHIYNISTAAGAWEARLDGVSLFSTATNAVGWRSAPILGMSERNNLDDQLGQFYFAELMIFNQVLSTTDRATQLNYLADRHGITV